MKIMQFPNKKECYHSIDFYVLFSCKTRTKLLGMAEINSMEPAKVNKILGKCIQ